LDALQSDIAGSKRVKALLSGWKTQDGKKRHAYSKWQGAHWVLADLADIGYPSGDESLIPLRERVYDWLLSDGHKDRFLCINGKWRRCASQEGNAIYYLNTLGLADDRTLELVDRLEEMQWPDGGWNCRKTPNAQHSSFMETITPMRGLIAHAKHNNSRKAKTMAKAAADIFLKRELYLGQRDGNVIKPSFIKLHYPTYWHYDILFALKVLGEGDLIDRKKCSKALDLLESKRLADGGFASESPYYRPIGAAGSGNCKVRWGSTGKKSMNEFVTVEALSVLKDAGRGVTAA
jgi:hypothetical protein